MGLCVCMHVWMRCCKSADKGESWRGESVNCDWTHIKECKARQQTESYSYACLIYEMTMWAGNLNLVGAERAVCTRDTPQHYVFLCVKYYNNWIYRNVLGKILKRILVIPLKAIGSLQKCVSILFYLLTHKNLKEFRKFWNRIQFKSRNFSNFSMMFPTCGRKERQMKMTMEYVKNIAYP